MGKVTLKEIAKRAGVTANTVSRAINNRGGIGEETKKRILQIADELNYIPDRIATSLRSKTSNLLGVMVPDIADAFWAEIFRGVEDVAFRHDLQILLSNSKEQCSLENRILDQFRSLRVGGLLLMPSYESRELIQKIAELSIPCVLINRRYIGQHIPYVMPDNVNGIRQAVSHLIERGHEVIGFLNGHPGSMTSQIRYNAFTESLRQSGIDLNACPYDICSGTVSSAYQVALEMLSRHPTITAMVCFNDMIAFGVYKAIQELGWIIPKDIAIVGFDDVEFASIVTPPLTTVHTKRYTMGQKAMELLLKAMDEHEIEPEGYIVETQLIVRGST